ncbi:hypothetical protein TNCV_1189791 [Trichonephila clavipes]|nr:hypothetical protein TNCV_1189791 [Trichonephila clavipes]
MTDLISSDLHNWDNNQFDDDHRTRVGGARSCPIRFIVRATKYPQFHKEYVSLNLWDTKIFSGLNQMHFSMPKRGRCFNAGGVYLSIFPWGLSTDNSRPHMHDSPNNVFNDRRPTMAPCQVTISWACLTRKTTGIRNNNCAAFKDLYQCFSNFHN